MNLVGHELAVVFLHGQRAFHEALLVSQFGILSRQLLGSLGDAPLEFVLGAAKGLFGFALLGDVQRHANAISTGKVDVGPAQLARFDRRGRGRENPASPGRQPARYSKACCRSFSSG